MKTWFPIVGAPAVWFLQGLLLWLIATWACPGGGEFARTLTIGISAVALVIALAAFLAATAGWRRSGAHGLADVAGASRADFAACAALLVSGAALVAVLAAGLPTVMLSACQPMR